MTTTYVETADLPLKDLQPYPGNAKRGNVQKIRESIRTNGQYRSLVVRRNGADLVILAGNHTYRALKAERRRTARCEVVECDDATARRINLADNRTAELGEYDDQELAALLAAATDDGGLDGTGWHDDDLMALLARTADAEPDAPMPGDRMQEPGDAPQDDRAKTWGVIVITDDEAGQVELLDRLIEEGWDVRALMG